LLLLPLRSSLLLFLLLLHLLLFQGSSETVSVCWSIWAERFTSLGVSPNLLRLPAALKILKWAIEEGENDDDVDVDDVEMES